MKLHELTAYQARTLLRSGEISSLELTRALLDRTARVDPIVGAYLTVFREQALLDAELADRKRREEGDDGLP